MRVRLFTNIFTAEYKEIELYDACTGDDIIQHLGLEKSKTAIQTPDGILQDYSKTLPYSYVWVYIVPGAQVAAIFIVSLIVALAVGAVTYSIMISSLGNQKTPKFNTSASLRGSSNTARLNQRLPLILGRYKVTPDLAAQVYTSYANNDQFLHQLFCFGYKDVSVDLSTLKIGTTPVSKYAEVTYKTGSEISQIYPRRALETSIGIELDGSESFVRSTASGTTSVIIGIAAPSGFYSYNDDGNKINISIGLRIEYKKSADSTWTKSYEGTITPNCNATAWRWAHTITLPYDKGTYDIRVTRTTAKSDEGTVVDYAYWDVMTCFTQDTSGNTYTVKQPENYALLAMKIRASNQLNGYVDSLSAYVSLQTRYFNGTDWVKGATRNPAAAVLYLLTDKNANPRPVSDEIIDWDSFEEFYQYCEQEGFSCDAQFSGDATVEEFCSQICQSNLATLIVRPSRISIRLDKAGGEAVQMFTPHNASNITLTRSLEKLPTILKCKFNLEDVEYTEVERTVRRNDDGTISYDTEIEDGEEATEISLAGVTKSEHAARVLAVRLKQLYARQRTYSWQTDIEGMVCLPGDVVLLSVDSFLYGLGEARVKRVTPTYIEVDSEFTFVNNKSYGVKLRKADGSVEQHSIVSFDEGSSSILVVESPSHFSVGDLISFGYYQQEAHPVQITSISIDSDKSCTIQAVDYDDSVFADLDTIPAYDPGISLYPEGSEVGNGKYEIPDKPSIPGAPGSQGTPGVSVVSVVREFSVADSNTVAPVAGWQTDFPEKEAGKYIWVRDKVNFSNGTSSYTTPYMSTGDEGGNPVVFFQWGVSNLYSPADDYSMLVWDEDLAITWDLGNDQNLAFIYEEGEWKTSVPDKPEGLNYLWMKSWNYQTSQWDYIPVSGNPSQTFDLEVNPSTFKLTSRGITKTDESSSDGYQRIRVKCLKMNTTALASWGVSAGTENWPEKALPGVSDAGVWHFVNEDNDAEIEIILNNGMILSLFTIYCQITDIGLSKTFLCSGVREGAKDPLFLGRISSASEIPSSSPEGPLMSGDFFLPLFTDASLGITKNIPRVWGDNSWHNLNSEVDAQWYSYILSVIEADVWASIPEDSVVEAYWGYFANVIAKYVKAEVIEALDITSKNLVVGPGTGEADSGFRTRIGYITGSDGAKTPVMDVMWGDNTVFRVDPESGKIFFGQPSADLVQATNGFMYNPSDKSISSANGNIIINSTGRLTVKDLTYSINQQDIFIPYVTSFYKLKINSEDLPTNPVSIPVGLEDFVIIYEYYGPPEVFPAHRISCFSYNWEALRPGLPSAIIAQESENRCRISYEMPEQQVKFSWPNDTGYSSYNNLDVIMWIFKPA